MTTLALNLPQRQDSLADQLADLIHVANANGMYDAADFLRDLLANRPRCSPTLKETDRDHDPNR